MNFKGFIKAAGSVFLALSWVATVYAQDPYPGSSFPSPYNYHPVQPPPPEPPVPPPDSEKTPQLPIHISADHVEQIPDKNQVRAWGRVLVVYGKRAIRADRMIINPETGKGEAFGHVLIIAEDGTRIRSTKALLDIKSKKGRMYDARGILGKPDGTRYFVKGKEISKKGENRYEVKEASLTTCRGELPDWLIQFDEADVQTGDRALFKGGVVKIRNMPVGYIPVGYVPLDNERKSGFLTPSLGSTNLDGFTIGNSYFWAIDDHQDATLGLDYMEKRGVRTNLEYRYMPSPTMAGQFNGIFLDDQVTGNFFWKIDAFHRQELPYGWSLNGKLDLTSSANFNKTFRSQTENRTRRSSDSWATLYKIWGNQSFDILTRLRQSEQVGRDDIFGLLPQATWKTQPVEMIRFGEGTGLYFNQDSSFATFLTDLDGSTTSDQLVNTQRMDLHPQVSLPMQVFPWLNFTPKVGVRETFYSDVYRGTTNQGALNRELIDVNAILEGPKINKIFGGDRSDTRFKHIIEPRFQYDFIPDMDSADRSLINPLDGIDAIPNTNQLTFFLTQRLLQKVQTGGSSNTQQIARFEISQSYNILEADRALTSPQDQRRPFSFLRFDFDSRPNPWLMLNFDSTLNVYSGNIETFNFDVGVKPTDNLMIILERRMARDTSASILGTLNYNFLPGWDALFSVRFDEFNETILEKNGRLSFNDPCECWGVSLDVIQRFNINNGLRQEETKFLFNLILRGLGEIKGNQGESFIHRSF